MLEVCLPAAVSDEERHATERVIELCNERPEIMKKLKKTMRKMVHDKEKDEEKGDDSSVSLTRLSLAMMIIPAGIVLFFYLHGRK